MEISHARGRGEEAIRVRWGLALLVSIPLIVLNCGWIAHSEMKTGVTEITIQTLFLGVTFILFFVTLLNRLVRRFAVRAALTPPELMVVYGLLSLSSAIAGIGNIGFFLPFLVNAFWFGNDNNKWVHFYDLLPANIGPRDKDGVLKGFFEGQSTFFRSETIAVWAGPLLWWSVFFLALLWTLMCLAAVIRRRWAEEEHLPFPVVALPVAFASDTGESGGPPVWRNQLLWVGFAIPLILHSWNSVAYLFPTLPLFPFNKPLPVTAGWQQPWRGLGEIQLLMHPCGVGFGYLVNTDVLFSLFFFYWLKKLAQMVGTQFGWRDQGDLGWGDGPTQFPYVGHQAWGAWLTVAVAVLWQARPYLRAFWNRAWDGDPHGIDAREPMSARMALLGAFAGFLVCCGMVWTTGGSLWVPLAFLGIYLLLMLTLSRLEAETAVLSPLLGWVDPQGILTGTLGTGNIVKTDLARIGMLSGFNLDYRAAIMPQQLQAFMAVKRAGASALSLRPLPWILMAGCTISLIAALLWDLQLYYTNGAATANVNVYRINMGSSVWWRLIGWLDNPKPPESAAWGGMSVGAGIVALLSYLRTRFVGFPLSPSAYVLSVSWANELFWADLTVAWLIKASFLRYGGIRLYRQALPFFLGLILGDFVTSGAWSLFGMAIGVDMWRTFPN
jgi:hypothetical protein